MEKRIAGRKVETGDEETSRAAGCIVYGLLWRSCWGSSRWEVRSGHRCDDLGGEGGDDGLGSLGTAGGRTGVRKRIDLRLAAQVNEKTQERTKLGAKSLEERDRGPVLCLPCLGRAGGEICCPPTIQ